MSFWETIKSWLGNDIFSVFVYAAIVALFVIGIVKCVLPVVNTRRLLQRAIKNIKKGDKARRSWQDDRFLGRGCLMPHWSEYLNNLFFADNEYHNPANVEDYINEETVIESPGRVRLAEALPGVSVSLGFLGTLMGLSVALGGMGADVSDVSGSMTTLLGSMKYAFMTSIFGVVASILFTMLTRIVHGRAERTLLSFYNAMARYAGVLSVEPMTQIAIYQQEQTSILNKLLERVDPQRYADAFNAAVQPLTQAVRENMELTSQRQSQLMNDVADAYIRRMDDAVHGQFDHLKITLEDTCRYQEKAIKNVADALSSFGDAARAMREIRQQSQEILDRYEGVLNRLSQAQLRNADETERLSGVVEKQTEYIQTLSALNDEFARQADSIREVTENFLENTGSMTEQHNELLTETAQKMSDASQTLAATMTDAREKLKRDMDESINYFEGCMTEILKRIEWASNAVKESVEGLPEAVQVSTGRYLDEIDHLVGALRAANGQLDDAGNRR